MPVEVNAAETTVPVGGAPPFNHESLNPYAGTPPTRPMPLLNVDSPNIGYTIGPTDYSVQDGRAIPEWNLERPNYVVRIGPPIIPPNGEVVRHLDLMTDIEGATFVPRTRNYVIHGDVTLSPGTSLLFTGGTTTTGATTVAAPTFYLRAGTGATTADIPVFFPTTDGTFTITNSTDGRARFDDLVRAYADPSALRRMNLRRKNSRPNVTNHRGKTARLDFGGGRQFDKSSPEELVALTLLRKMIPHDEFRRYLKNGFVNVQGSSGLVYQIFRNSAQRIKVWDAGKTLAELCVHLEGWYNKPPTDEVVAKMLIAEHDEPDLWKRSNKSFYVSNNHPKLQAVGVDPNKGGIIWNADNGVNIVADFQVVGVVDGRNYVEAVGGQAIVQELQNGLGLRDLDPAQGLGVREAVAA